MPFTLAHPAAVVPLRKLGPFFLLSPLVVGSMAPDFEYFLRQSPVAVVGHTLPGLFTFCLPLGLCVLWVFHRVVKDPVIDLFPAAHQEQLRSLPSFSFTPPMRLTLIGVLIVLGAGTHLAWDGFTHVNGAAVEATPDLRISVFTVGSWEIRVYKLLQHGSTIVGMAYLLTAYLRWAPQDRREPLPRARLSVAKRLAVLGFIALVAMVAALGAAWGSPPRLDDAAALGALVVHAGLAGLAGAVVATILYAGSRAPPRRPAERAS